MEAIRKLVHLLSFIVYFLIGIYALVLLPYLFNYTPLVVLSGSMETTLMTGSIIYYKEVEKDELEVGDIITYRVDDLVVTHRINEIKDGKFVTKGDANNIVDPIIIDYKDVLGVVGDFSVPYLGYYVRFINENLYILIFVVLILLSEFFLGEEKTFDINKKKKGVESNEK